MILGLFGKGRAPVAESQHLEIKHTCCFGNTAFDSYPHLGSSFKRCEALSAHPSIPVYQGRSHDSSGGQVEFVPSLSDLDFSIGAIEIFSYGYFEYRTLVAS